MDNLFDYTFENRELYTAPLGMPEEQVREQRRVRNMGALSAWFLSDVDKKYEEVARRAYGTNVPKNGNSENEMRLAGGALADFLGIYDNPELYWINQGMGLPDVESLTDLYPLMARDFSARLHEGNAKHEAELEALRKGREDFYLAVNKDLPKYVFDGVGATPEAWAKLSKYDQSGEIMESVRRAQQAGEWFATHKMPGGSMEGREALVQKRVKELRQEDAFSNSANAGWGVRFERSDEELRQQALHDVSESYALNMTRGDFATLAGILRGKDRKLDPVAMGAFMQALRQKAEDEQSLDSKFWRNAMVGLARFGMNTLDELNRGNAKMGQIYQGPDMPIVYLNEEQGRQFREEYSEEVEEMRSYFQQFEDTRLKADESAGEFAAALSGLGTIAGETTPYLLASAAAPGLGGLALGAAMAAPSQINREIGNAYREHKTNAELYGLIKGSAVAVSEGFFATGALKATRADKALDMLAVKTMSLPAVGNLFGAMRGSLMGRLVASTAIESGGELVVEDLVADGLTWASVNGLRKMGVAFDEERFAGFKERWDRLGQDGRQTAHAVAFCVVMGLLGAPAQARAAEAFASNRENLMALGVSRATADKRALQVEKGELRGDALTLALASDYQREVIEDPIGAARRLKEDRDAFLSEVNAKMLLREGVLQAALKESGVISSARADEEGMYDVTVRDDVKLAEDSLTWEKVDGEAVAPEGYETPTKVIKMSGEALAAYARVNATAAEIASMREIRSRALAKDAGRVINEGEIARVIPLSSLGSPVLTALARSEGTMTLPVLQTLANAAGEAVQEQRALIAGVSNMAIMRTPEAAEGRFDIAAQQGDKARGVAAIRYDADRAESGARSAIVINDGLTTMRALAEDDVEAVLRDEVAQAEERQPGGGRRLMQALATGLEEVRQQILADTGTDVLPGFNPETADEAAIVEYFSNFAQSAFYQTADARGLSGAARFSVEFMDKALSFGAIAQAMQKSYAAWSKTEAGKAFEANGGVLGDLLRKAGVELGRAYENARVTAENLADVMQARAEARGDALASEAEVRTLAAGMEAEQRAANEATMTPVEVTESVSEDVSTEELAELIEQERSPLTEDGNIVPPMGSVIEVEPEGAGKGMKDGEFSRLGDGSMLASARVEDIHLSADVPQVERKSKKPMKYRKNYTPITVWRRKDGRLELITGQRRLEAARQHGEELIAVRVFDEDATHDARWARLFHAEQNIRYKQATVEQVAYYYREKGLTDLQAEEQGLVARDANGRPMKTLTMGATIARLAPQAVYEKFLAGEMTAQEAYAEATKGQPGGISMALDLDNGLGAMQLAAGVSAKEEAFQKLLRSIEVAGRQWNAPFKGSHDSREKARGSTIGLAMGIYRKLPAGYRVKLEPMLRKAAVLERMIATGKLRSYGQISSAELAELRSMVTDRLADNWRAELAAHGYDTDRADLNERPEGMTPQLEKEFWETLKEEVVAQVGSEGMQGVYREVAEETAAAVRRYLHDTEMQKLATLLDRFTVKIDASSRRPKKGSYGAAFVNEVRRLQRDVMGADASTREAKIEKLLEELQALNAKKEGLTAEDEAKKRELDAELADWMTFGALATRGYEDVRAARLMLGGRAAEAREFWTRRLEANRNKLKAIMNKGLGSMGEADENQLAAQEDAFKRSWAAQMGHGANGAMSIAQLMYTMTSIPGLGEYAAESVMAIARGNNSYAERQAEMQRAMDVYLETQLGLKTEKERNDWAVEMNKIYNTSIRPEAEEKSYNAEISVADAERWLGMTDKELERARKKWNDKPRGAEPPPAWAMDAVREAYHENMTGEYAQLKREARAELRQAQGMPGMVTEKAHMPKVKFSVSTTARVGGKTTLDISKNRALNVILLFEQPRYMKNAEKHGFTEEVRQQLYEFVGEDVLKFGYWMRDYMSNNGLKEVFEAREGVPFPEEENYWTGRFDLTGKMEPKDALEAGFMGFGSRYDMLKTRVDHDLTFDLTLGATNVFLGTMAQQNTYICLGGITAEWRSLLANRDFARSLRKTIGESRFEYLKEGINLLDMQGVAEAAAQRAMSRATGFIQSMMAVSLLACAPFTVAKQCSAVMHGASAPGANFANMAGQLIADRFNKGPMTYGKMLREQAFRVRMAHNEAKNKEYNRLLAMGADVNYSRLAGLGRFGMQVMEAVDVRANAVSMTALYNLTWKRLVRESKASGRMMSDEQMHAECMREVEVCLDQTMMPMLKGQQSIARAYGGAAGKSLFFMAGEMLNKSGIVCRDYHKAGGGWAGIWKAFKFLSTMSMAEQLILMSIEAVRGPGDDDELDWQWALGHLVTGVTGAGLLNNVPILGDAISEGMRFIATAWGGGQRRFIRSDAFSKALGLDFFNQISRQARSVARWDDMTAEEWFFFAQNAARTAAVGGGMFGGANATFKLAARINSLILSVNAALNAARPVVEAYKYHK